MASKFTVEFDDIKNRIVIPTQIRKIEKINKGDVLEITVENKSKKSD